MTEHGDSLAAIVAASKQPREVVMHLDAMQRFALRDALRHYITHQQARTRRTKDGRRFAVQTAAEEVLAQADAATLAADREQGAAMAEWARHRIARTEQGAQPARTATAGGDHG